MTIADGDAEIRVYEIDRTSVDVEMPTKVQGARGSSLGGGMGRALAVFGPHACQRYL